MLHTKRPNLENPRGDVFQVVMSVDTLYNNRHDRMLRPLYHSKLEEYEFSESENSLPWYKPSRPVPCLKNGKAKVLWGIPWYLEKCPRIGANKPETSVLDQMNLNWYIIEGTMCMLGTIAARTMFKRDKYVQKINNNFTLQNMF